MKSQELTIVEGRRVFDLGAEPCYRLATLLQDSVAPLL